MPGASNWYAAETARQSPRSLKLPVGFIPSSLMRSSRIPSSAPRVGAGWSGVPPSPSFREWRSSWIGRTSW